MARLPRQWAAVLLGLLLLASVGTGPALGALDAPGSPDHASLDPTIDGSDTTDDTTNTTDSTVDDTADSTDSTTDTTDSTVDDTADSTDSTTDTTDSTVDDTADSTDSTTDTTDSTVDDTTDTTDSTVDDTADSTDSTVDDTADTTDSTTDTTDSTVDDTTNTTDSTTDTTDSTVDDTTNTTDSTTDTTDSTVDETTETVTNATDSTVDETTETVTNATDSTVDETTDAVTNTTDSTIEEGTETVDGATGEETDEIEVPDSLPGSGDGPDGGNATDRVETVTNVSDSDDDATDAAGDESDGSGDASGDDGNAIDGGDGPSAPDDDRPTSVGDGSGDPATGSGDEGASARSVPRRDPPDETDPAPVRSDAGVGPVDAGRIPVPVTPSTAGAGLLGLVALAGVGMEVAGRSSVTSGVVGVAAGVGRAGSARSWVAVVVEKVKRTLVVLRYSRYDDSDPLELDSREAVFEAVDRDPGVHLTAIPDRADVPLSTVRYHLRILEEEGLVESAEIRGRKRYFLAHEGDHELQSALADPATATLLEALVDREGASVSSLADELGRDPSTITHHCKRLAEDGLVERERDGRAVVNRPAPRVKRLLGSEPAPDPAVADD